MTALLVVEFVSPSTLVSERDRPSALPIVGNGPPGTFVLMAHGLRVSLPTDQIVAAEDSGGFARVAFGGMRFTSLDDTHLTAQRVREVLPDSRLSPARSHVMRLETAWIRRVLEHGQLAWSAERR